MIVPGDLLMDRYDVGALIASGGMADVFRAHDRRLDRAVAVKVFRVGAADPRRFENEIRVLAALNHPHLVAVYDAGEHDGAPFVVLQYVDGPTLAERLAGGPLADDDVRRLGVDLAGALDYVHRRRIVHRDVKPSNILFEANGSAVLGDFGVALLLDAARLTVDASTIGTAAYLAPEQAAGREVDAKADVYALGLVLLEGLTGRPTYSGTLQEVISAKLAGPPSIPVDLDPAWRGLLARMTRDDPRERPAAREVLAVLGAGGGGAAAAVGDATRVLPAPAVVPVPRGRWWWRRAVVAAALILLFAGAMAWLSSGGTSPELAAVPETTTSPSTSTSTSMSSTTSTTSRAAYCADLKAQKEAVDDEISDAEEKNDDDDRPGNRGRPNRDDDDDDEREEVVDALKDRKQEIEDAEKLARC